MAFHALKQDIEGGVLLADPNYHGTLAAVRALGRAGVPAAVLARSAQGANAAHSRYCRRTVEVNAACLTSEFLDAVCETGRQHVGLTLATTSDDMVWFVARHFDELKSYFNLPSSSSESLLCLTDKARMYALAQSLGIAVPATFAPTSMADVAGAAQALFTSNEASVIVKPRTHCGMVVPVKGWVAHSPAELDRVMHRYLAALHYLPGFLDGADDPIQWPLIQAFCPDARHSTYSLAGYACVDSGVLAARASTKVLQMPVKVGIGVAFEGRPLQDELVRQITQLVQAAGYAGPFEAEFIHEQSTGRFLLMDFNPRFYGQMQFEIGRGMNLPLMMLADARKQAGELGSLVAHAHESYVHDSADHQRYCNSWQMKLLLAAQRISGSLTRHERGRWHQWMAQGQVFDSLADPDDPEPLRADQRRYWGNLVRHPRSALKELFS